MSCKPHDFIRFRSFAIGEALEQIGSLYAKGLSLAEVAVRTETAKSTAREALLRGGVALRPKNAGPSECRRAGRAGKPSGKAPYRYCFLEGELARHPLEYPTLLTIVARRASGANPNAIAVYLDGLGFASPMARKWSGNSVANVLRRFDENSGGH